MFNDIGFQRFSFDPVIKIGKQVGMLAVHQISKSYHLNTVLKNITFTLKEGERAALVGPNGCGKSTLLDIIAGLCAPDSGYVALAPAGLRIGYLQQGIDFSEGERVGVYLNRFASNLEETLRSLERVCEALSHKPEDPDLIQRYESTLAALDRAQEMEGVRQNILVGFELDHIAHATPIAALSGGQKVRLALAGVLLRAPDILLLDEPTNHLDIEMRDGLTDWVLSYAGAILLVSHDRAFLDAVIHKVIAFPPSGEGVREYAGNYSDYLNIREAEFEEALTAFQGQQDEIKRLKESARAVRQQASAHKGGKADPKNTDGFSVGHFKNRALETMRRAKHLEKRIAFLEGEGQLEKPVHAWEMRMQFSETPESGQIALQMDRLEIGYDGHSLLPPLQQTVMQGQRIAVIGPNGVGKSTLFKTLLGEVKPICGTFYFGSRVQPGYLSQEQEILASDLTVLETIHTVPGMTHHTAARTFLHRFLFAGDEVFQPVATLSYGQRSRLMLALLVAQNCNFLLLDEPLNHLDLESQEAFETALMQFEGTILAIAHDRYFVDHFAQIVWEMSDAGMVVKLSQEMVANIFDS